MFFIQVFDNLCNMDDAATDERLLNSGEETRRKIDEMREKMLNDYGGKSK